MELYEMSLLRGKPIPATDTGDVHPLKLSDIERLGIKKYQEALFCILFEKTSIDIPEFEELVTQEDVSDFDAIFFLCVADEVFKMKFLDALSIFFKSTPSMSEEGFFYFGDIHEQRIIHRENFEEVKTIIRKQNMIQVSPEEKAKSINKKTEEIMKKLMSGRKQASSKDKRDGLTLEKIISIVASNSPTLNHLNIWDYTIYQLYEYFNRMMKRDNFEQQFNLLLQGADIKSSDLKHWAT